jgi:hypothetical protein
MIYFHQLYTPHGVSPQSPCLKKIYRQDKKIQISNLDLGFQINSNGFARDGSFQHCFAFKLQETLFQLPQKTGLRSVFDSKSICHVLPRIDLVDPEYLFFHSF